MCSVQDDIEELCESSCSKEIGSAVKPKSLNICRKCGEPPVILLQKKDPLCQPCFNTYVSHKFKSTIGKSKIIKPSSKVLIAYSGGACSSAMLFMVKQALSDASHKKLLFFPSVLHIDESFVVSKDDQEDFSKSIVSHLSATNYPILFSSLEMAFRDNDIQKFYWGPTERSGFESVHMKDKLNRSLGSIKSLSSKQDYLECLRMQLMRDIAEHAGYTHIFVGESATTLAIKSLSTIAMGRGSQISFNTSFSDCRSDVMICRPMREFLNSEIFFYNHSNKIPYVIQPTLLTKTDIHSSIQRLSEAFVCNLQENFPATVFTIFRTSGKVTATSCLKDAKCILCKSPRDNINPNSCSAIEALLLSIKLSRNLSHKTEEQGDRLDPEEDTLNNLQQYLCHGCSIIFSEMSNCTEIPPLLLEKLTLASRRSKMYEEIKDFILVPEEKFLEEDT